MEAQSPRCCQEGARARDRRRRVLGWLDEDGQLRLGRTSSFFTSSPSSCSQRCLGPPPPPRLFSFVPYRPLALSSDHNGGGSHTHPCLVEHLVIRAFGLRYFTPNYRGQPHPKRRRTPRHAFSKRSCCSRLCFYVSHRHPLPRVLSTVISCLSCPASCPPAPIDHPSRPLPYAILMHLHFHHLHLSPSACYSRPSPPSRAGLFRLSCIECNNRSNHRLR